MSITSVDDGIAVNKTVSEKADGFGWTRNVKPEFKHMETHEIREVLAKTQFPFAVCMENFNHDFNVSVVIRNTNAFNGKKMFYFSPKKKYDARGAVGCKHYTDVEHLSSIEQLIALKKDYVLVGVDCVPGSISMTPFEWPDNTLMVFGSEGVGLSEAVQSICSVIVHIDQFGSVPSLNAACASAIAMFDYTTKYRAKNP